MKIDNCPVNKKDRYNAIDGLRTFAAIGVLAMHVNENSFCLSGFISERVIGVMGDFVFLFMIISGFSMCCGYYDKITNAYHPPVSMASITFSGTVPPCISDFV